MGQITLKELEDEFKDLRKNFGCQEKIPQAGMLTSYFDYRFISPDHKISCIITLIRHFLSSEQAGLLLASLNLIVEYKNIPNPERRREKYQEDILGSNFQLRTLLNKENRYIADLIFVISKSKADGELTRILESAPKELILPTLSSIKNTAKAEKEQPSRRPIYPPSYYCSYFDDNGNFLPGRVCDEEENIARKNYSSQADSQINWKSGEQRAVNGVSIKVESTIPKVFSKEEASSFLLAQTAMDDQNKTTDVAKLLGYFPLALELAAAYIKVTNSSFSEYLRLLNEYGLNASKSYHDTIHVVWQISIEKICKPNMFADREPNVPEKQLLFGCAYLAPDEIDLSILAECAKFSEKAMIDSMRIEPTRYGYFVNMIQDSEREKLVNLLRKFALVKTDEEGLMYIPQILQEIIREEIGTDTQVITYSLYYLEELITRLHDEAEEIHEPNGENTEIIRRNLAHLLSIARYAEALLTRNGELTDQLERTYIIASTAALCLDDRDQAISHIAKALMLYKDKDEENSQSIESLGAVLTDIIEETDWSVKYGPAFRKFATSYQLEDNRVVIKIESNMNSYANNPPEPIYYSVSF